MLGDILWGAGAGGERFVHVPRRRKISFIQQSLRIQIAQCKPRVGVLVYLPKDLL